MYVYLIIFQNTEFKQNSIKQYITVIHKSHPYPPPTLLSPIYIKDSIKMQRTSIFAHSNKLIPALPHNFTQCANCIRFQQQNQQLRIQLSTMAKQIQKYQPIIKEVLRDQNLVFLEQEVIGIKGKYQGLLRKIGNMQKHNTQLNEQNQRLQITNRKIKKEIANLRVQNIKIKQQNQTLIMEKSDCWATKTVQTDNIKQRLVDESVLLELNPNIQGKDKNKAHEKEDSTHLLSYLQERERIQIERNKKINELGLILQDF